MHRYTIHLDAKQVGTVDAMTEHDACEFAERVHGGGAYIRYASSICPARTGELAELETALRRAFEMETR